MTQNHLREPVALNGLEFSGSNFHFLQLSDDSSLITLGSKMAVNYDNEVKTNYFSPSYLPITSALYKDKNDDNVVILGNKKLLIWDGKETKLEKVNHVDLMTSAHDLINREGQIFIVFEGGDVQSADYVKNDPGFEPQTLLDKGSQRSRSGLGQNDLLWHLVHDGKSLSKEVVTFRHSLDPDNGRMTHHLVSKVKLGPKAFGVTVYQDMIYYVDQQGHLKSRDLLDEGQEEVICEIGVPKKDLTMKVWNEDHLVVLNGNELLLTNFTLGEVISKLVLSQTGSRKEQDNSLECDVASKRILYKTSNDKGLMSVAVQDLPESMSSLVGLKNELNNIQSLYEQVQNIFEKDDLTALEKVVNKAVDNEIDVPELIVLNVVEFLFEMDDDHKPGKDSNEIIKRKEKMLLKAFNLPITEGIMLQYISQMDFGLALQVLEFLTLCLQLENGEHSDQFQNLIKWSSLLLNAHYGNILRSSKHSEEGSEDSEILETLNRMLKCVQIFERSSSESASLMPLIKLIEGGALGGHDALLGANSAYCIEVVDF